MAGNGNQFRWLSGLASDFLRFQRSPEHQFSLALFSVTFFKSKSYHIMQPSCFAVAFDSGFREPNKRSRRIFSGAKLLKSSAIVWQTYRTRKWTTWICRKVDTKHDGVLKHENYCSQCIALERIRQDFLVDTQEAINSIQRRDRVDAKEARQDVEQQQQRTGACV